MSDTSKDGNDVELEEPLELELQPEAEMFPASGAGSGAAGETVAEPSADTAADEGLAQGQWVWQYAAPPPPPSFAAVFFSGQAVKSHYRFFACALLVVVGCLLPWGPAGEGAAAAPFLPPGVAGYQTVTGAISLALGLWLLFAACYGVYTGRHKILPVFLMIEPAVVAWLRTADAWGRLPEEFSTLERLQHVFDVAGTGVMLTLVGSTWVAGGFLLLLGKVYAKKDDKGSARRSARGGRDKPRADGELPAGEQGGGDEASASSTSSSSDESGGAVAGGNGKDKGGRAGRRGRRG